MYDLEAPSWKASLAGLAVILAFAFYGMWVNGDLASASTPKKPTNPLVIKTAKNGTIKVIRAVVGGRLYVMGFVFKQGVWFFVGGEPAVDLPGNPRPSPKS